jgi:antitoxin (DNA-binding transcriptional repressor) of toxin-antitoxin stability system
VVVRGSVDAVSSGGEVAVTVDGAETASIGATVSDKPLRTSAGAVFLKMDEGNKYVLLGW